MTEAITGRDPKERDRVYGRSPDKLRLCRAEVFFTLDRATISSGGGQTSAGVARRGRCCRQGRAARAQRVIALTHERHNSGMLPPGEQAALIWVYFFPGKATVKLPLSPRING